MKLTWNPDCPILDTDTVADLNMAIERQWWRMSKVIVRCKNAVKYCLQCPEFKKCELETRNNLLKFLERNKIQ